MPSQPPGRSSSTALQTEDQPAGAGQDRPRLSARTRRVLLLALVLLAGAAFRIAPLADNRFHPDEALFATLGRLIITGKDPLLTETTLLVDKPPLLYYLLAAGISVSWGSEVSARLPGLFASMITIALTARLAWRLWGRGAAPLAALFVALSPFAIAFAPTAFSDPLMLMWALAGLTAAAGGRWFAAGLLLGCALATKQTGVLFLPLAAVLGVTAGLKRPARPRDALAALLRFAPGLGVVLALMLGWEALRGGAGGAWLAGIVTNNPGRLAAPAELGERALGWLRLLHEFTGSFLLDVLALALLTALAVLEFATGRGRGARASALILAFAIAYLALHWLAAVPLLDRYLLPLVPLLALLVARALTL
ncbi:MAG: glycosyltransferase family 39 protein, partial [Aggregatilineales bacterium]